VNVVRSSKPAPEPKPAHEPGEAPTRLLVVGAVAVVAIGVVLRFVTKSDLWLDEALSVNVARLPLGDLPDWLRHDGAPPLYYVLLHGWTDLFGEGAVAVRALSGVFGVAAIGGAWLAARQIGDRTYALIAVVLMAINPYAIRYATETRMYVLEMVLVFVGIYAVRRAWMQPSAARLTLVAVVTAALLYTHYWALYLLVSLGVTLVLAAWRQPQRRPTTIRLLVAIAVGALTFVPWLPTFTYQAGHTGTPWGHAVLPGIPIGQTLLDFAGTLQQEGWVLLPIVIGLLLLGVFGRAVDGRRIELDLRTQPALRWEATVGALTLLVGTTATWLSGNAFQTRYSAIVLPFFVLVVARAFSCLTDPRVRFGILAFVVAGGLVGGARNIITQRTNAGKVADVINAEGQPGDVVVFCPDQLGPALMRLIAPASGETDYVIVSDPPSPRPGFLVDWVNYTDRVASRSPVKIAQNVLAKAGDHTVWFVSAPGYITHAGRCDEIAFRLGRQRNRVARVLPPEELFEKHALDEFPPG
jgi:uncharacterized membrane protein